MSIKEVLEHPWIAKFCNSPSPKKQNKKMTGGDVFKMYSNPYKRTLSLNENQSNILKIGSKVSFS